MACEACTKRGQTWRGDPPVCGFGAKDFSDNWSCATVGGIRSIVYEGQELPYGVTYTYCDDMKYATVKVDHLELPSGSAMALWVAWYKSRGRTDAMWLLDSDSPPRQPTEADCLAICAAYGVTPDGL